MVTTHVIITAKDRTYVYIPAFLRKTFDIIPGSTITVTTDGTSIILTPVKKDDGRE